MKKPATILLMLIVFLQTFSRFVVEADYFLNKSYIAKVLCINKEKPKLHCNGKCYLARQLKEEQQQQTPVTKKSKIEVQLFNVAEPLQLTSDLQDNTIQHPLTHALHLPSFPHSIFRPPTV